MNSEVEMSKDESGDEIIKNVCFDCEEEVSSKGKICETCENLFCKKCIRDHFESDKCYMCCSTESVEKCDDCYKYFCFSCSCKGTFSSCENCGYRFCNKCIRTKYCSERSRKN